MSALSGPRSDDGGETGTGGPPERRGTVQGELRAALAEALEEQFSYATQYATVIIDWDEEAEALLPTVRRIVAEELRAAATDVISPMVLTGNVTPNAVRALLNRADALGTPTTGGGE